MEISIYMVGVGGHGLQQVGKTLAESGWRAGYHATYSPKYEPAKRGGLSSAYVVVSDEPIGNPRKRKNDILVLMDPDGYRRFHSYIRPGGVMLVNSSMVSEVPEDGMDCRRIELPLSDMANNAGSTKVISAVLLGAIAALLPGRFGGDEALLETMLSKIRLNDAAKQMNIKAFNVGIDGLKAAVSSQE